MQLAHTSVRYHHQTIFTDQGISVFPPTRGEPEMMIAFFMVYSLFYNFNS